MNLPEWAEALATIVYPGLASASIFFAGLILYEWYYRRNNELLVLFVLLVSDAIGFALFALASGHTAVLTRQQIAPLARVAFAVALVAECYIIVLYIKAMMVSIQWTGGKGAEG